MKGNASVSAKMKRRSFVDRSVDNEDSSTSSVVEYCKTFLNVLGDAKSPFKISSYLNTLFYIQDKAEPTPFAFDKILQEPNKGCTQYFSALLPLLETVFFHKKDATLIAYGPKGTGKSSTLGTTYEFRNSRNALNDALNYFYTKGEETRADSKHLEIYLSCFEVCINEIKDLLEDPHRPTKDGEIGNFYACTLSTAVKLLTQGLKQAKKVHNGTYKENKSHIFINISVMHKSINSLGEVEEQKGVLTLIDLAGWDCPSEVGTESVDNSTIRIKNKEIKMDPGNMSDMYKLSQKVQYFEEVLGKSNFKSLKSFKALIFSLGIGGEVMSETDCVLTNLFMQNLKTDSKIYIMGHVAFTESDPIACKEIIDTLDFCIRFKMNIGEFLMKMEQRRKVEEDNEEYSENPQSILKELKEEEPTIVLPTENKSFDLQRAPNVTRTEADRKYIPPELVNKIAEIMEDPSPAHTLRVEEPIVDATVSKINCAPSDRDNSHLTSFFSGDENAMMRNIKNNHKEIKAHLGVFLKDVGMSGKETRKNTATPLKEPVDFSSMQEHASESKENEIGKLGHQLAADSFNCVKEFCYRSIKFTLINDDQKRKSCFCNKYCGGNNKIFDLRDTFDEPLVRNVFFPVAIFDSSRERTTKSIKKKPEICPIRARPKGLNRSRIVEEMSFSKGNPGISFNAKTTGGTSKVKHGITDLGISYTRPNNPVSFCQYKRREGKSVNRSKYGLRPSVTAKHAWGDNMDFSSSKKEEVHLPNIWTKKAH